LGDALRERRAFHELEHEGRDAVRFLQPVDRFNVGMVQRSQHFGLASKAFHALLVTSESLRQNFDGDVTLELRIASAKDLSHAARTNGLEDLVVAETRACGKRHRPNR